VYKQIAESQLVNNRKYQQ